MRDRGQTTGRIDSRFKGRSIGLHQDTMVYDPMTTAIGPSYLAAFMDYYTRDLKVPAERKYKISGNVFGKWDWKHAPPGSEGYKLPFPNTSIDLAYAMAQNPHMKVLFQQGVLRPGHTVFHHQISHQSPGYRTGAAHQYLRSLL